MVVFVNEYITDVKLLFFSSLHKYIESIIAMNFLMKTIRFTSLPGDGIGPEVMSVALGVLQKTGSIHGFTLRQHSRCRGCRY